MYKNPGNILEKLICQGNVEVLTAPKGVPLNIKDFVLWLAGSEDGF